MTDETEKQNGEGSDTINTVTDGESNETVEKVKPVLTRPKGDGKVGQVWALYDQLRNDGNTPPTAKVYIGAAEEAGYNKRTASTQYYRWKKVVLEAETAE